MRTLVQVGDVVVTSDDPQSTEDVARGIAKVLSKYWLQGASQDEPLIVLIDEAYYTVRAEE